MLLLCPIFDDLPALYAFEWTLPVVFDVGISCLLALGVNITNYLVLGKTSPLTYQVVGHLKTIFTISFGILILHHPTNVKNLVGVSARAIAYRSWYSTPVGDFRVAQIGIALIGVVSYTEVKRRMQLGR